MGIGLWLLCDACGKEAHWSSDATKRYWLPPGWSLDKRCVGGKDPIETYNYYCSAPCRLNVAQAEVQAESLGEEARRG